MSTSQKLEYDTALADYHLKKIKDTMASSLQEFDQKKSVL